VTFMGTAAAKIFSFMDATTLNSQKKHESSHLYSVAFVHFSSTPKVGLEIRNQKRLQLEWHSSMTFTFLTSLL